MIRPILTLLALAFPLASHAQEPAASGRSDREFTVATMDKIARPVLSSLSQGKLKASLPLGPNEGGRRNVTHLEAFGRTLAGIAPWLALGPDGTPEGKLRAEFIEMARKALIQATDPQSPDFLNYTTQGQPLVDAAFLSQGLLRAPDQLWEPLTAPQKRNVIEALKATRRTKPPEMNWLLFSALVEAAIWELSGSCELKPIEHALKKHEEWYLGDGTYGDGPQFHWDYYNSFVIQPALLDVLDVCKKKNHPNAKLLPNVTHRARRYAEVQERMISPEGTFPVIGRSSTYRFGAFQVLSQMALRKQLPPEVPPAAARGALTAVIRRVIEAPGTFDANGWLRAGAVGYQPTLREGYISTGSLYLCTVGMLHLGLPANDPFWTSPAQPWTQKRIWAGEDIKADHAYGEKH